MDGCDVCLDQPQHAHPRIVQLLLGSEQRPLPVRLVGIAHRLLVHEYDSVADLEHSIEHLEAVLHCRVETASDILSSVGLGSLPASALCSDAPTNTSSTTSSTSSPSTPTPAAADAPDATAEEANDGAHEHDGSPEKTRRRGKRRSRSDSPNMLLVGEKLRHCAPEPDATGLSAPCREYLMSALDFYENWSGTLASASPISTATQKASHSSENGHENPASTSPHSDSDSNPPQTGANGESKWQSSIPAGLEPSELAHFAVSAVRECLTSLDELGPFCARTTAEGLLKHLVAYEFQLCALDASLHERHANAKQCTASAQREATSTHPAGEHSSSGCGSEGAPRPQSPLQSCACAQQRATVGTALAFVRLAQSQLCKVRLLCDAYFERLELNVEGT